MVRADFAGTRFSHAGVATTFSRRGDRFVVRTDGPDGRIADFDVASTPNESAIAVAKDSEGFLDAVNDILDEMEDSGKIEELIRTNIEIMDEHTGV